MTWVHIFDGTKIIGGQTLTVEAALDIIPVSRKEQKTRDALNVRV